MLPKTDSREKHKSSFGGKSRCEVDKTITLPTYYYDSGIGHVIFRVGLYHDFDLAISSKRTPTDCSQSDEGQPSMAWICGYKGWIEAW